MAETNNKICTVAETIDEAVNREMCNLDLDEKLKENYRESPSYLPFSDYFMSVCFLTAARSKDPVRKVGACIVSKDNRVLSVGYNGMPRGVIDYRDLPWDKHAENICDTKYPYDCFSFNMVFKKNSCLVLLRKCLIVNVCHAEMNAIMNLRRAVSDFQECCIYVSKFPCPECAKLIIQSGLGAVVYTENKPEPFEIQYSTMRMFELAGVKCTKYTPSVESITINFTGDNKCATFRKLKN